MKTAWFPALRSRRKRRGRKGAASALVALLVALGGCQSDGGPAAGPVPASPPGQASLLPPNYTREQIAQMTTTRMAKEQRNDPLQRLRDQGTLLGKSEPAAPPSLMPSNQSPEQINRATAERLALQKRHYPLAITDKPAAEARDRAVAGTADPNAAPAAGSAAGVAGGGTENAKKAADAGTPPEKGKAANSTALDDALPPPPRPAAATPEKRPEPPAIPTEKRATPVASAEKPAPAAGAEFQTAATAAKQEPGGTASAPQGKQPSEPAEGPIRSGPVLPAPTQEAPIDLANAWRLAGLENPTIALAQARITEAAALYLDAATMMLPTLNAGLMYHLHKNVLQASPGIIRGVDEQSLYFGGGARALAAEAPSIPMVRIFAPITDAIYAPLAARQVVRNRRFEAAATSNSILLDVTTAYFALLGAEAQLEAIRQAESDAGEVVRLTRAYALTGRGRQSDADRARTQAQVFVYEEQRAQEGIAVETAALARLLNLDPSIRLRTPGGPLPLLQLVNPTDSVEQLIQIALRYRPEMPAQAALVAAGEARLRQEQMRPLLPLLSVGYSAAGFGGGSNLTSIGISNSQIGQIVPGSALGLVGAREDFDVMAVWTWQNLGFGNIAIQRQRRAEIGQAVANQVEIINRIRREVTEAYALSASRRRVVETANQQMQAAEVAYRRDLERIRGLQGRPIELMDSVRLLNNARLQYIRALIGYDQAQFQLFVAMGQPPFLAQATQEVPPGGGVTPP